MSFTFRQGDLPKLDLQINHGSDFTAWQMQWESYRSLSGLEKESAAKQVQSLMLYFSRDILSIIQNLGLTEEQRGYVGKMICAIKHYIIMKLLNDKTFDKVLSTLANLLMIS